MLSAEVMRHDASREKYRTANKCGSGQHGKNKCCVGGSSGRLAQRFDYADANAHDRTEKSDAHEDQSEKPH